MYFYNHSAQMPVLIIAPPQNAKDRRT